MVRGVGSATGHSHSGRAFLLVTFRISESATNERENEKAYFSTINMKKSLGELRNTFRMGVASKLSVFDIAYVRHLLDTSNTYRDNPCPNFLVVLIHFKHP